MPPYNGWAQYGIGNWFEVNPALAAQQMQQIMAAVQYQNPPIAVVPEVPNLGTDEEGTMINNFRVGCDPEFMLLDASGRTVNANRYFPQNGEIGYDHNGRVAEFRPSPSKGVFPIVKKIQNLIKSPRIQELNTKFRAGAVCNEDCLGGHVHFGFNVFVNQPMGGYGVKHGYQLNERGVKVTKALDALTKTLEHLDILPKLESDKRRKSAQGQGNHYGSFGDVRDCNGHMEYRTMASWLYDPRIAFLCLTAAKLAAADPEGTTTALENCTSFTGLRKWLDNYKTKDINATRASEKILEEGLRPLQVDPTVNFRERWENLGL
jgi:hypothetical protein